MKHSIGIFSRSDKGDYAWLVTLFSSRDFSDCVQDVRSTVISNSGFHQFIDNASQCSFGIIYHTKKRGRVSITDIPGSLYDEELDSLNQLLGRNNVIVVIDDVEDSSHEEKIRILKLQPTIEKLACDLLLISKTEKNNNKTLITKLRNLIASTSVVHESSNYGGPDPHYSRHNLEETLTDTNKTKCKTEDSKPLHGDKSPNTKSTHEILIPRSSKSQKMPSSIENLETWDSSETEYIFENIYEDIYETPDTRIKDKPTPQLLNRKSTVWYFSENSEKLTNNECQKDEFSSKTLKIGLNSESLEKLPSKGFPVTQLNNDTSRILYRIESSNKPPIDEFSKVHSHNKPSEIGHTYKSSETKHNHERSKELCDNIDSQCKDGSLVTPLRDKCSKQLSSQKSTKKCAKNIFSPQLSDPLKCKLCGKDENSALLALPVVKGMVYRLELQSAGLFRCSKTRIKFQVTRPVTIEYEVDSWNSYSSLFHNLQSKYEILGPLFNIKTDLEPGVVSEVYLPHCLCLKGFKEDTSCIKCAHFKDDNITLEAPTRVEPYYVVLENPTFSPIGIILYPFMWLSDGITKLIPFHGMVLIYWRISGVTDPDHRKFRIHLYLMPYNQSVEMDINSFEKNLRYDRLYKPHQTDFLYCGRKYEVKASQNARVLPKTLLFQSSYVSGLYPYTEVTVDDKETIKGFGIAVEDGDSSVWQAEVDRGDINDLETEILGPHPEGATHDFASCEHFVDKHRPALIRAISLVEPILEQLRSLGLLIVEQYETICSKPTSQEQMRELYRYITHWGNDDKDKVYQILRKHNRPVINKLKAEGY